MGIAVLIPAAGSSSRMRGSDKLTRHIAGVPLLRRQAASGLQSADHVCVTIPDHNHPRRDALAGMPVQLVAVPDADLGMSASIRRGVAMLPRGTEAVVILPADMPEITPEDIAAVIRGFRANPFSTLQQGATADGVPGHPVLFPADCFAALAQLDGDTGARQVLKANEYRLRQVPLPGQHALTDLDTPEAWAAWEREPA